MNSRQRVRMALSGQQPDRVPMAMGFFPETLPGIGDVDQHFGSDVRYAKFNPPPSQQDFQRYLRGLPEHVHVGNLSQLQTYHEWNYHPELGPERPLSQVLSVEELAEAVLPDLTDPRRYAGLAEQVDLWHRQGLAVAGSPPHLGGELFETAWRMRGFENFMLDLALRRDIASYLLDQLTEMLVENALILARAGVDILLLDDDVAMPTGLMIGPSLWREFFGRRLERVIGAAREVSPDLLVFYHSDGDFTALIPELVAIGVNVINPVQPDCMDAVAIRQAFGTRLAFWGTVGRASTWDHGSPEQIRAEVQERVRGLGTAGLLLSPAYDIDFTPLDNLTAFAEAVQEFGTVDEVMQ